jgi:arabinogalactan oligomer/maltooligosaccharide transport system permease protein
MQQEVCAMETESKTRRYLPAVLWGLVILSVFYIFYFYILPNADGITLTWKMIVDRVKELGGFLLAIFAGITLVEIFVYQLFFRRPKNLAAEIITRALQIGLLLAILAALVWFFELTDLIRLQGTPMGVITAAPSLWLKSFNEFLAKILSAPPAVAKYLGQGGLVVILLIMYGLVQLDSVPKHSKYGLPYMLVLPAFLGMLFLIIYPFLFEIRLAFSNASLGTQATKNAEYGLIYGWNNLVALFTGNVAKEAGFFEVFWRTVIWTAINVSVTVSIGMGLALLLNRPMRMKGLYRTLLIFPWAMPSAIAILALRNEFDNRYGLFNILLTRLQEFLGNISVSVQSIIGISTLFTWLAATIGPVSWRQDPTWAFVSVLISNIWLGIPFMAVIILGGLQSISAEYYEAAEIDGASKFQMFRNITLPLIQPVLTPAIVLGVVWTFNRFEVIYLITQGGPQEKTDILVSSMYKAAFQFYRYGFTAMFALVIFLILLVFTIIYLRVAGGLKSATEA